MLPVIHGVNRLICLGTALCSEAMLQNVSLYTCCPPRQLTAEAAQDKSPPSQEDKDVDALSLADWPCPSSAPGLLSSRGPPSGTSSTLANALSDPAPATTVMEVCMLPHPAMPQTLPKDIILCYPVRTAVAPGLDRHPARELPAQIGPGQKVKPVRACSGTGEWGAAGSAGQRAVCPGRPAALLLACHAARLRRCLGLPLHLSARPPGAQVRCLLHTAMTLRSQPGRLEPCAHAARLLRMDIGWRSQMLHSHACAAIPISGSLFASVCKG